MLCQLSYQGLKFCIVLTRGPGTLRKAECMRSVMGVLADHYMVRKAPDGSVEYDRKARREGWEVRL